MGSYYVNHNAQGNGDQEVHLSTCKYFLEIKSKTYLGEFFGCGPAIVAARSLGFNANGCYFCCEPCHTS